LVGFWLAMPRSLGQRKNHKKFLPIRPKNKEKTYKLWSLKKIGLPKSRDCPVCGGMNLWDEKAKMHSKTIFLI
jgi:hypothetical protein